MKSTVPVLVTAISFVGGALALAVFFLGAWLFLPTSVVAVLAVAVFLPGALIVVPNIKRSKTIASAARQTSERCLRELLARRLENP